MQFQIDADEKYCLLPGCERRSVLSHYCTRQHLEEATREGGKACKQILWLYSRV